MLRFLELALFLSPFVGFALWRLLAPGRPPSPRVVALAAAALVILAGGLFWYSREDVLPSGTAYAPAQFQDGRLVPSHPVGR